MPTFIARHPSSSSSAKPVRRATCRRYAAIHQDTPAGFSFLARVVDSSRGAFGIHRSPAFVASGGRHAARMIQLRKSSRTPSHSLASQLIRGCEADSVTSRLASAQRVSPRLIANGIESLPPSQVRNPGRTSTEHQSFQNTSTLEYLQFE